MLSRTSTWSANRSPGDRVLLNTTALAQGLGTGGYAMVVAIPDRLPPDPDLPGHLVKARYTPTAGVRAGRRRAGQPGARRPSGRPTTSTGCPWSSLTCTRPSRRCSPGCFADRPGCRAGVRLHGRRCPPPGLLADRGRAAGRRLARRDGDDRSGVRRGPRGGDGPHRPAGRPASARGGRRGRDPGTRATSARGPASASPGWPPARRSTPRRRPGWPSRGVPAGVRRGRPAAPPGVSHHSLTAYGRVALVPADVVVPRSTGGPGRALGALVAVAGGAHSSSRHRLVEVSSTGLHGALAAAPVPLSTMGRGLSADPAAFLAAAAAGRHAATLVP